MIKSDIIAQLKDCYGITDDKKDQIINLSIKKSLLLLEQSFGCNICKTDNAGTDIIHSMRVNKCLLNGLCPTIYTCIPKITELVSIDNKIIEGAKIVGSNCIQLPDNCVNICGCCKIEVKYKGGLEVKDILNLFMAYYEYENNKCDGRNIKKLTLGDKTTERCNCDDEAIQSSINQIMKIYKPYKSIHYCQCQ